MMRKRRSKATCSPEQWSTPRVTLFLALIVIATIGDSRGDYLMGGHLDNNDDQGPRVTEKRGGTLEDSNVGIRTAISSRTGTSLENLDRDFDLGLDLLAEQSVGDPSRTSMSSSSLEDSTLDPEEGTGLAPRYRVPLLPYAFNGGQPFSLEKDPITGQIDFEKAPPLKVLDYSGKSPEDETNDDVETEDLRDTIANADPKVPSDEGVGPNEINPYSPSFHDFLNLPVRYTYNKYENSEKYPLISSSYANTKVQSGTNSYNTYNHKKYHESVKASVNIHLQPSRKTYVQPVQKQTTKNSSPDPSTRIFTAHTTPKPPATTTKATSTTTPASTTTTTTTISPPPTTTTTTTSAMTTTTAAKRLTTFPAVTTWKPQRPSVSNKYSGEDYEDSLPIERLQTDSAIEQQSSSTEPSRYAPPPSRPSKPVKDAAEDEEYDEGYEDYDRFYQSGVRPTISNDQNDTEGDYSYGLDFFGVGSRPSMRPLQTTTTEKVSISTTPVATTTTAATATTTTTTTTSSIVTHRPFTTFPTNKLSDRREDRLSTTSKPSQVEEKHVTSMPLDTSDHYIAHYGTSGQKPATIDNSIPSITNNVVYHQLRPSNNDKYYGGALMGMSAPEIVVKSTSNVVVPPGQDTVSFVLGNRQSVGSASNAGGEYYPVHSGLINDRQGISFGKIGSSASVTNADNYPGQMIVSAGIGIESKPGTSYYQRPQTNENAPFDHALVSVGLPTVDVVNPMVNKNSESSTSHSQDSLAHRWWSSTSDSNAKPHQDPQPTNQHHHQFGYHVVFPSEKNESSGSVANDKTTSKTEEHVIVIHESDIEAGNTLHLELPSQQSSTSSPTAGFYYESSTQRFTGKPEDHVLPELSESLTPPAERPNRVQQAHRPPNYNYYHHSSGNSRPNDYPRPQRVPIPPPPSSSTSSSSNGFKRHPGSSLDSNLPNILPQFRPNAKVSHGHNRGDNVGTIPAGSLGHYPNPIIRRPPPHHHHHLHRPSSSRRPSGPSHLQRLNPPPLPPPPPPITSLRLPTPAALIGLPLGTSNQHDAPQQTSDNLQRVPVQKRIYQVAPVGFPPSLNIDERHQSGSFTAQQIKSRLEDENLEGFSAEPPHQPPRAPFFGQRSPTPGGSDQLPEGIPRVATLQMIQQHGGDDSLVKTNLPPPYRFNLDTRQGNRQEGESQDSVEEHSRPSVNRREDEASKESSVEMPLENENTRADYADSADSPVYVVYPVKGALDIRPTSHEDGENGSEDASVVLGKYGAQRPLPPDTLLKDSSKDTAGTDDQAFRVSSATPFTDSSSPQLASDFPYPLERPDPSIFTSQLREKPLLVPSEHQKNNQDKEKEKSAGSKDNKNEADIDRDASVNVIPYPQDHIPFGLTEPHSGAISATLHRLSGFSSFVDSSSTPIAYVYTPTTRSPIRRPEEGLAHLTFERTPVLLQSQHANPTDSGPAAPQNFMAPFVASASAEAPTKNGWSVVMLEQKPIDDSTTMDRRRADTDIPSDKQQTSDKIEEQDQERHAEEKEKDKSDETASEDNKNNNHGQDKNTQTEKNDFNVENFTPQLFGGFKPIFEFPSDTDTDVTLGDKVNGGAIAIERPRSRIESDKISVMKSDNP